MMKDPRPDLQGGLVLEDGLLVWESARGTPPIMPEEIDEAIEQVRRDRESRQVVLKP